MPSDTRTRGDYASMLMDAGQWERAIAQATEVLRLTADDFSTHTMLGAAYDKLNRLDEACEHLEAAARLQPQFTGTLQALGQVYFKQGRFAAAAECFRKVLALQPHSEQARAGLQAAERELRK
jgi:Flp pilus assembly protein TadD